MADQHSTPPSTSSNASKQRSCPNCKYRMSSLDRDPHVICIKCREVECTIDNRCVFCASLTDQEMTSYLKYQVKLSKDRDRKKSKPKSDQPPDFAVLCTTGGGSSASGVGDVASVGPEDSVSVAQSRNTYVKVSADIPELKREWASIDDKIVNAVNRAFSCYVSNPSFSAPQQVSGRSTRGTGSHAPPPSNPPDGVGQVEARVGRRPAGKPSPPPP